MTGVGVDLRQFDFIESLFVEDVFCQSNAAGFDSENTIVERVLLRNGKLKMVD